MKKIVLVLVAAMVLVFTGCEKKETISMPFDVADVNNIEMYRNAEPYSAEKQVITESEDIADLYSLFSGLEVSDKKTEPVVGETITSCAGGHWAEPGAVHEGFHEAGVKAARI